MVSYQLAVALANILVGLLIIIFPKMLRVLVGGYLLLSGIFMLLGFYL